MARAPRPSFTAVLDRSSPVPLWSQLHAELLRRIEADRFAGGFPGELELADRYQVSRSTVREAMRALRAEGLVVAERGRRPRVVGRVPAPATGALDALLVHRVPGGGDGGAAEGLLDRCTATVRSREVRWDPPVAERLGQPADAPLLFVERLLAADGSAAALDRAWFPAESTMALADAALGADLYAELARHAGVAVVAAEESVHAAAADPSEREALGLGAGAAVLVVERLGRGRRGPVEWRRTAVSGSRGAVPARYEVATGFRAGPGA